MSQIFNPSTNTLARMSILAGGLVTLLLFAGLYIRDQSVYTRPVGIAVEQPIRFSHELHSGQLNIGCLYCHGTATQSSYGGIPDTHTCMSCHSQIATYSELLEPVRQSYEDNTSLVWNRVHDLADHVYFNHSAHVNNGVGCESCHGNVEEMPLVWRAEHMTMGWCLDCHRNPEEFVRPADEVYTFGYETPENQTELGFQLIEEYGINVDHLMSCGVCHY